MTKMKDIQILKDVMEIENNRYKMSDNYSVTELLDPPRLVRMKKKYSEQIVYRVESQIDSLMGTAMHALFEQNLRSYSAVDPHYSLEKRLKYPFVVDGETRIVSGQYDIVYKEKDMTDIKTAKTWKLVFDPELTSWTQQQNIYAALCRLAGGLSIETISALIIYKDWTAMNAIRDPKYPREPIELRPLNMWSHEEQEAFIMDRLQKHIACEELEDKDMPVCSAEERWERFPDGRVVQFAYFKNAGGKRANKVLHDATDIAGAVETATKIKGCNADSWIEIRHCERKRCEKWCPVNDFCDVHQEYMRKKKNNALNDKYPLKEYL